MFGENAQRQFHAKHRVNLRRDHRRIERIAAQVKKIVVPPDGRAVENFFPNFRQ